MDKQEDMLTNRDPIFNGSNFIFLNISIEVYPHSLGMDVWKSIEDNYKFLKVANESEENNEF